MAGGDEKNTPATDFGQVLSLSSRMCTRNDHGPWCSVAPGHQVRHWDTLPRGGWKARTTLLVLMRCTMNALQGGDGPSKEEERRAEKERAQSQKVQHADQQIESAGQVQFDGFHLVNLISCMTRILLARDGHAHTFCCVRLPCCKAWQCQCPLPAQGMYVCSGSVAL